VWIAMHPPHADKSPAYPFYVRGTHYLREEAETIPVIDDAIHMFYRATLTDSTYVKGWAGLGEAYWFRFERTKEKTSRQEAERAVARAIALDPKAEATRLAQARGYAAVGKAEDARKILVDLVKDDPDNDAAWAILGRAYRSLGKYELGVDALHKAIAVNPRSFRHHVELGAYLQKFEEYVEAEKEFKTALAMKKDSPTAWVNLGASYLLQDKPREAIPALTNALRYEPRAATFSNLGTAYYYVGDYEKSAQSYREAAARDLADPVYPGNLGDAYRMLGRKAEADSAYAEAVRRGRALLEQTPDNVDLRANLALWYARSGNTSAALAEAGRALRARPDDVEAMLANAVVRASLGRNDEALDWLERAVRLGLGRAAIMNDPDLSRLRGQPRFDRVLELAS